MKRVSYTTYVWGLILIAAGVGFLLDSLGYMNFGEFASTYWPAILIIIGAAEALQGKWVGALLFGGLGILFQLRTLGILQTNVWQIFWPLLIIWFGLNLLLRTKTRDKIKSENKSYVSSTGIFGGDTKNISSDSFRGASLNAVFGGSKLDLRNAKIAKEGAVIDVLAVFGGGEILVAKNTQVAIETTSLFGGVDDKTASDKAASGPVLTIRGLIIFGGLEIKN